MGKRGKIITFTLKVTQVEVLYDIVAIHKKKEQKINDLKQQLNEYQENKENNQQINDLREKLNAKSLENQKLIAQKAQKVQENEQLIREKQAYQKAQNQKDYELRQYAKEIETMRGKQKKMEQHIKQKQIALDSKK